MAVATKHTGSLSVVGTKSAGSVRKLCPPRRARVSNDLPFRDVIGRGREEILARVLIRRKVRSEESGGVFMLMFDRIVRILPRNLSRCLGRVSSGAMFDWAIYYQEEKIR